MKTRLALLMLVLLPLAACKRDAPAAVDPAPAATPSAAPAVQEASAEDPAAQAAAEAAVQAAAAAAAQAPPPVEGVDYVEIPNGQPFATTDGRIEVVEFFGYVCPACAAVQPTVRAMKAKLPPDVNMIYIPAAFGQVWDTYAKAFYTAEAMGVPGQAHDAMYRAIHIDRTLKGERGGGADTPEQIAAFYANYGADPKQFVSSMQSFAVAAQVSRGKQYMMQAFANGDGPSTPAFVVNGKYRVKGKGPEHMFRVLNQLIVAERARGPVAAAAAQATAPTDEPAQP